MNVADLMRDGHDALGFKIICIYARKAPEYALYRTDQRLLVHFADDAAKSSEQRKLLAQLAPLRGEINGLVDGWRVAPHRQRLFWIFSVANGPRLHKKAERYDRRAADALQVGLEGDIATATLLLERIKEDILNERIGWSRFEYLLTALFTSLVIGLLSILFMAIDAKAPCAKSANQFLCLGEGADMWRGFIAGALGAFFSIALGIRGRTILPDLYRPANLMDALLRVVVGAIGGLALVSLIRAGFVRFSIGDSSPGDYRTIHILVVGFVAGFTERLVPDLLAKAAVSTGQAPIRRLPEPAPQPDKPKKDAEDADAAAGEAADDTDPVPDQENEEACVADNPIPDDEVTKDEDLPASSGGVAKEEEAK